MLLQSGCAIMEELRIYCYEGSNMKAFDAYLFLVECGIRNKKYDSHLLILKLSLANYGNL